MDDIIISIPKNRIRVKAKNIPDAIRALKGLRKSLLKDKLEILRKFAGIGREGYVYNKQDWYQQ
jgi:hypothetical protein